MIGFISPYRFPIDLLCLYLHSVLLEWLFLTGSKSVGDVSVGREQDWPMGGANGAWGGS